jgi:phosphoribosylformimino-5-aminoimidazole carboxamide ribotide isomerase
VIAVPAVDLRDGACVQLVGGAFDDERIRIPDGRAAAQRWSSLGFTRLHVVDLDAARGDGDNAGVVADILATRQAATAVGGGVRTAERVAALVDAGAERVIVGTRALEEPEWLEAIAARFPGRVVVAADVRGRTVVTRAWAHTLSIDLFELVARLNALPLGGLLVTAVHVEGQMKGPDLSLIEHTVRNTRHDVIASGGTATIQDLRDLQSLGASACVIGMALYSGAIDATAVAEEFGA